MCDFAYVGLYALFKKLIHSLRIVTVVKKEKRKAIALPPAFRKPETEHGHPAPYQYRSFQAAHQCIDYKVPPFFQGDEKKSFSFTIEGFVQSVFFGHCEE